MISVFNKRPSEYRIREKLPNGQQVNLYFARYRTEENMHQWNVSFYIGNRKEANKRYNKCPKNRKNNITGNGSITALRWALKYILAFVDNMKQNEELVVGWEDDKRGCAYQYLKRYGFIDYLNNDGKVTHLGIRNPLYWEREE